MERENLKNITFLQSAIALKYLLTYVYSTYYYLLIRTNKRHYVYDFTYYENAHACLCIQRALLKVNLSKFIEKVNHESFTISNTFSFMNTANICFQFSSSFHIIKEKMNKTRLKGFSLKIARGLKILF